MARANPKDAYATAADFERILTEDVNNLYLLAFLLTGDPGKAEDCFVAGIEEFTSGNPVFKEWARSWARRTIIKSAIRLIQPCQRSGRSAVRNPALAMQKVPLLLQAEVSAILEFPPLERFVFVMSVLERYSDYECSILLRCPGKDVAAARMRAVQQLERLLGLRRKEPPDANAEMFAVHESAGQVNELEIARYFFAFLENNKLRDGFSNQFAPV